MINILIITFGTSNRNNMLAYSFEQLGAKVYIYDFFNYKDRKEYYKLEEPISGLVLAGYGNRGFEFANKSNLSYLIEHNHSLYKELMKIPENYQNIPILGICYGCQVLNKFYGGALPERLKEKKTGKHETILLKSRIFKNMPNKVWADYNHRFLTLTGAPNAKTIAYSGKILVGYEFSNIHYGVQFHIIKSDDIVKKILSNFYKICLDGPQIQNNNKVIYGLSGILLIIYALSNRLKK